LILVQQGEAFRPSTLAAFRRFPDLKSDNPKLRKIASVVVNQPNQGFMLVPQSPRNNLGIDAGFAFERA